MKLGIPGSLTVVCGVGHSRESVGIGHSRESHGSLLGLGTPGSLTVVCGVGHSRESHGSLLGLESLTVVCWDWALQGVSR